MSLWRKRNNVHHNEQKPDHLVNIVTNLSIQSDDLSIKSDDLSIKSNMIWVDPPEGWKFGFPAIYDPEKDGQMSDWIISKGYPIQIIKEYGEQWMVRCWPAEEPR